MEEVSRKMYLSDIAYLKIKDLIIRDELSGPIVSESELATLLNMSRTPIREALNRLQNDEFLEVYPKRGIYIKEMTVSETNDLMNVRLAIELFSMDKIGDVFQNHDLDYLENKVVEQEVAMGNEDIFNFIKLDLDYHEYLLKVTGNQYFVKTLNNVNDRIYHHGMKMFKRDLSRIQMSIDDHKVINGHLKNRDFTEARHALEQHIQTGKKQYLTR
ncbi:GntR family transcriptional regulator [Sporosarcina sp. FSL K6-1540]|uniref:GntR family transcriptional regulator n=1 Tax=Sporosarcina sp. FSL K6-1540 TaxID=2921555 RepID=UPI00315A55E0